MFLYSPKLMHWSEETFGGFLEESPGTNSAKALEEILEINE